MPPVLFLFDYIITFAEEVRFLQGGSLSWATAIFLLNRYSTFAISITYLFLLRNTSAAAMSDESAVKVSIHSYLSTSLPRSQR